MSTPLPPTENVIKPERLRATVERLAAFPTRNTLSPTLREAAEWLVGQYRAIDGVQAELFPYVAPKGRRVPKDTEVVQVVAWVNGEGVQAKSLADLDGKRVVLVGGHMDSLNLQVDPATGRAPGANDDASGVAVALECARAMAGRPWKHTVVFVGFSGEEQGLLGSAALAKYAQEHHWRLDAVLSCDTVGSSSNKNKQKDDKRVRVFSDEADTNQSRELARWIEWKVRESMKGFGIKLVLRADRFGRGGDHTPFAQSGFSAVRFVEVHEEYTRQHTPDDLPEFMDWNYLANVTRANLVALSALANAAPQPTNVRIVRDQSHDATLEWAMTPGAEYTVLWRDTASTVWQKAIPVGSAGKCVVKKVNKDDHFFAVSSGGIPVLAK